MDNDGPNNDNDAEHFDEEEVIAPSDEAGLTLTVNEGLSQDEDGMSHDKSYQSKKSKKKKKKKRRPRHAEEGVHEYVTSDEETADGEDRIVKEKRRKKKKRKSRKKSSRDGTAGTAHSSGDEGYGSSDDGLSLDYGSSDSGFSSYESSIFGSSDDNRSYESSIFGSSADTRSHESSIFGHDNSESHRQNKKKDDQIPGSESRRSGSEWPENNKAYNTSIRKPGWRLGDEDESEEEEEIPQTITVDASANDKQEEESQQATESFADEATMASTQKTQTASQKTNADDVDDDCRDFCLKHWKRVVGGAGIFILLFLLILLLVVALMYGAGGAGGGDGGEEEQEERERVVLTYGPTRAPVKRFTGPQLSPEKPSPPSEEGFATPRFPTPPPVMTPAPVMPTPELPTPSDLGQQVYTLRVYLHESAAINRIDQTDTFQVKSSLYIQLLPMKFVTTTEYTTLLTPGSFTFELFDPSILARDVFANDNKGGYLELQIDNEPIFRLFADDIEENGGTFDFDIPYTLPFLDKPTTSPTKSSPPSKSPTPRPTPAPTRQPTPSPTSTPTAAPSSLCDGALEPTIVTRTLQITFQNEDYPEDNSFQLQEVCGRLPLIDYGSQQSANAEYTEELRAGTSYRFEVFDAAGDGFDSFFQEAFLELRLDGELIWKLEDFTDQAEFVFEVPA